MPESPEKMDSSKTPQCKTSTIILEVTPAFSGTKFEPTFRELLELGQWKKSDDVQLDSDGVVNLSKHCGDVDFVLKLTGVGAEFPEKNGSPRMVFSDVPIPNKPKIDSGADGNKHHQIKHPKVSKTDPTILTFNYRNRLKDIKNPEIEHKTSAFGFDVMVNGKCVTADPIISNGGNPSDEKGGTGNP